MKASVYTIPASVSFVDSLADGILSRYGNNSQLLSSITLLMPNKRSCRFLADSLLKKSKNEALILPEMRGIDDIDEEDELKEFYSDIPPAVSKERRIMLLSELISESEHISNKEQSYFLAYELSVLLDEMQKDGVSINNLKTLVSQRYEFSDYWKKTLDFFLILSEQWPKTLKNLGLVDIRERKNLVIKKQSEIWKNTPPDFPLIAAGSTGSIPTTASLLKTISGLENGIVILPALDQCMPRDLWENIGDHHNQSGLKNLIKELKISRDNIPEWETVKNKERENFLSTVMLPSFDEKRVKIPEKAVDGISKIEAENQQEEAGIISLIMRGAVEERDKTAALVTNDRNLAGRVCSIMRKWNINVNDSAGIPLSQTSQAIFLRLVFDVIDTNFSPVSLLSLLKHPFSSCGTSRTKSLEMARGLELVILKKTLLSKGVDSFISLVSSSKDQNKDEIISWLKNIKIITNDFYNCLKNKKTGSLKDIIESHINCAELLAETNENKGWDVLWQDDEGKSVYEKMSKIISGVKNHKVETKSYENIFDIFITSEKHRPKYGFHPRLAILSPIEARLKHYDTMILGGMNRGIWPEEHFNPWINKSMQKTLGFHSVNKKTALSSHDFFCYACAPNVIMTYSKKINGTSVLPSSWLLRIESVINKSSLLNTKEKYNDWLKLLTKPDKVVLIERPSPTPPVSCRPTKLPATRIENLIKNPYFIYARYILGLYPLNKIGEEAEKRDFGILMHDILKKFIKSYVSAKEDIELKNLLECGREEFNKFKYYPVIQTVWWARFEEIAKWFIKNEQDRRGDIFSTFTEIEGEITIPTKRGGVLLTAKADRIEIDKNNNVIIIDYKTGSAPNKKSVESGLSPQLTIEAVIVKAGGYKEIEKNKEIIELSYWKLSEKNPSEKIIKITKNIKNVINNAENGLNSLILFFEDEKTPYTSCPSQKLSMPYNDYEHLERKKEWLY